MKSYDILTFGDLCVDLIMTGPDVTPQFGQVEKLVADYTLEMGGSCSIFACQAAKLGLHTAILGRVGLRTVDLAPPGTERGGYQLCDRRLEP
jgi:sugar/nucleoside kinase (ribokinase family)